MCANERSHRYRGVRDSHMTARTISPTSPIIIGSAGGGPQPALLPVQTTSGQVLQVQTQEEADFYVQQQAKYLSEHKFTAVTDLQDLDRMLFFELLNYRATVQLASGRNQMGQYLTPPEEADCRRQMKEAAPLISNLKNDLGITKSQRDKEQFESVGAYLVNLRARAAEMGVHRQKQLQQALILMNQLLSLVGAYDRSDEVERDKLGLQSADDVLDWIRTVMGPEYHAVDAYFRQNQQRTWVRTI